MKIAVVAPTYIPAHRANTIQVMKMVQALVRLNHDVRLAVPSTGEGEQEHAWEILAHDYGLNGPAFPIEWILIHPGWRSYDYGFKAVSWARHCGATLLYTRHPQVAALSSMLGLATILEVHDLPQGSAGPLLFRSFLKGKGAQRLVVITHALAGDLSGQYHLSAIDMLVAPDGVDIERYATLPEPLQARRILLEKKAINRAFSPDTFTVGYSGHLYAGRGADMLLSLAVRMPEMTFLLVGGEPPAIAELSQRVQAEELRNVILTGFVSNAELPLYQAACDVLLMPYQTQVAASSGGDIGRYLSPMKLFEYLACGRPILASDLPVLQEVLNPQNAILLPRADLDAWQDALIALRNDPARRTALGTQARRDAETYTWEKRAAKVIQGLPVSKVS